MFKRYAIFFTPPPGAFADFGAAWLGWDSATGAQVPHPQITAIDLPLLTETPRKYGFHATLKAPFHLSEGQSPEALQAAVKEFARQHAPAPLEALAVLGTHGFVALRPTGETASLNALAARVVRTFDPFRAPLSSEDITRRRRSRLSPRQDQQMLNWGYPYVFEDFNFHMTLTGKVPRAQAKEVLDRVTDAFVPIIPERMELDAITLMGQDADGKFHQLCREPLRG
ncbi:MAG: DUF1045 domain-containing protein [Sulfitobacter sp.]